MQKFRNNKVGSTVAKIFFNEFKGNWEVFVRSENIKENKFWREIINEIAISKTKEFSIVEKNILVKYLNLVNSYYIDLFI